MEEDTKKTDQNAEQRPFGIRHVSVTPLKQAKTDEPAQNKVSLDKTAPLIKLKPPVIKSAAEENGLKSAGVIGGSPASKSTVPIMPQIVSKPSAEKNGLPEKSGMLSETPTVRIKPIRPAIVVPQQDVAAKSADKGKTSRISLDSALSGTDQIAPGLAGMSFKTQPVNAPLGKITSHITDDVAEKINASTVKLSIPDTDMQKVQQMTRKRTLRVKVPGKTASDASAGEDSSEAKTIKRVGFKVAPSGAGAPADGGHAAVFDKIPGTEDGNVSAFAPAPVAPKEKIHVFFPICASAAILVSILTFLLFASQAWGPDRSLTPFSSHPTWVDIGWPGKISQ